MSDVRVWPYAHLYDRGLRDGHLYPAPVCGSPSAIWHMALVPRRRFGDQGSMETRKRSLEQENEAYDDDFRSFVTELDRLASRMQARGGTLARPASFSVERLPIDPLVENVGGGTPHRFRTASPQSLDFEVWWLPGHQPSGGLTGPPGDDAVRVQVQVKTYTGYATVTLIVDASKPYGKSHLSEAPDGFLASEPQPASIAEEADLRNRIWRSVNVMRSSMARQVRTRAVDYPRLPEREVSAAEAKDLQDAANFLYVEVWEQLVSDFGIEVFDDPEQTDLLGRRFAEFRGLSLSTAGLVTELDVKRLEQEAKLRNDNSLNSVVAIQPPLALPQLDEALYREWQPGYGYRLSVVDRPRPTVGTAGFGDYDLFDEDSNEGHTVLRSLWPFFRRMAPLADDREVVGCGMMGWRAMYVSALGTGTTEWETSQQEVERLFPSAHVPLRAETGPRPVRFLVVTKGEPQREQLGRFIDRILQLETLRFFSLRNITAIRNSGVHLELIGRQLDGLLQRWTAKRKDIQEDYEDEVATLQKTWERRNRWRTWRFVAPLLRMLSDVDMTTPEDSARAEGVFNASDDDRARKLNKLISLTERQLIDLAAALDRIGEGGAGRILYAIRRATLATKDFEKLIPTLGVGDVPGWTSYPQFVNRGLKSSFGFIELTGQRIVSLRERLQMLTETIQTAALISETEATQKNTQTLRDVSTYLHRSQRLLNQVVILIVTVVASTVAETILPQSWRPLTWLRWAWEELLEMMLETVLPVLGLG